MTIQDFLWIIVSILGIGTIAAVALVLDHLRLHRDMDRRRHTKSMNAAIEDSEAALIDALYGLAESQVTMERATQAVAQVYGIQHTARGGPQAYDPNTKCRPRPARTVDEVLDAYFAGKEVSIEA